jgi:hypothetical protein
MLGSKQYNTPQSNTTNRSYSSGGEEISAEKIFLLKHRINVLEFFFLGNDRRPKREKKRKADSLAHLFNDDREASFLVNRSETKCGPALRQNVDLP